MAEQVGTVGPTRLTPTSATVGILFVAFLVVMVSGEQQSLGPVDLDTANRLAIGLWVLAPVIGGLIAGRRGGHAVREAARVGALLGVAVTVLVATAAGAGYPTTCPMNGIPTFVGAYFLGCLAVGGIVGVGTGLSLLVTAVLAARRWWLPGIVAGAIVSFVAGYGAYNLYYDFAACLR